MEPNILDLRQQRCPMALLLAKRHTAQLEAGDSVTILISDSSSFKDIESYLLKQDYLCQSVKCDGYNSLIVVKETSLHVRNG
ncbi:sulfurtransferase TusA family protein [Vibrio plantisponsor]|jgi:TusA-related sulfurtransferase|uniref:TusA-related sulfurtransferase n=2 Tax=Vibrio TaxID=662 RepID=A0A2J8GTH0_VIBDI|nr:MULTISPECIES: sulfurtransferase TusA family protein [Vibrio]MDW6017784.1 sulfurtransferase TusA family protein [Vibrio plantisponsor]NNM40617.1 sulfurtransferase TusA family protein [Vibrio plantisponsor]PNH89309.1 oxidoreductase [Vibrio diazotrophicus]RAS57933.1 TusA-related sulfurtransferase [Vibrio diazotrophicus]